ncbi:MAG: glycerol-3-phosphate 1-O-acyltransferase PlsY [bacterium]
MISLILIALLSYLVGSFPTSVVWGRITRKIDIREYGSKNAGGTNAFRVLGWQAGLLVAMVDVGKGMLAAALISKIRIDPLSLDHELVQIIAGTCAVIGHIWTVLAMFKGGKGVATAAGVLISIYPWAALICLAIFVTVVVITRYVSVASIAATSSLPIVLLFLDRMAGATVSKSFLLFSVVIGGLICFTHRANIRRLIEGTENRFGKNPFKKNA